MTALQATRRVLSSSSSELHQYKLVTSFLQRESPSSANTTPPSAFSSPTNPFLPTKTPGANSSRAPKYSLRRQKSLQKAVEDLGWSRLRLLPRTLEEVRASSERVEEVGKGKGKQVFKPSPHIPRSKILSEVELEKKGPYVGRKGSAFKGKMWERKFEKRQEELKVGMEGAEKKIAEWKKTKAEEKRKSKNIMPF